MLYVDFLFIPQIYASIACINLATSGRDSLGQSEQRQCIPPSYAVLVRLVPAVHAVNRLQVLHHALPSLRLAERREERVVRPEQHAPAAPPALREPRASRRRRARAAARERVRAPDDVADERELLGAVRDGVEVEPAEVEARVVLQARGDDGVVGDAGREARGQLRERAPGVCEEDAQAGVAVEDAGEDEARDGLQRQRFETTGVRGAGGCTHDGGLEREAEREREDVPVVLGAPLLAVHAVVRVEEHDEAGVLECGPHGLERVVVEAVPEAARAHDDALEMREGGDVVHGVEQGRGGDLWDEREEAEAVELLERAPCEGGRRGAVRLEVVVELVGELMCGGGGQEVEPWVRRAAGRDEGQSR